MYIQVDRHRRFSGWSRWCCHLPLHPNSSSTAEQSRGTPPCTPAPTKQDKQQIQAKMGKKTKQVNPTALMRGCWMKHKKSGHLFFKQWTKWTQQSSCSKPRRGETHLELGPCHWHVHPMGVWPPPQVLVVVRIVHRMVELVIDLWKPKKWKLWDLHCSTHQRFLEAKEVTIKPFPFWLILKAMQMSLRFHNNIQKF